MRTSLTTNQIRRSGFSLVELLVVAVLISLSMGAVIRFSMHRYRKLQVQQAARQLYLAAKFARLIAIESQQPCRLLLDEEKRAFLLALGEPPTEERETLDEAANQAVETALTGEPAEAAPAEPKPISNPYIRPVQMDESVLFEEIRILPMGGLQEEADGSTVVFHPDGTADGAVLQIGNGVHHYCISVSPGTARARVAAGVAEEIALDVVDLDTVQ